MKCVSYPLLPQKVAQKANLSFINKFPSISVTDEASDFKFGRQLGLTRPIIRSNQKKKWVWPWARGAFQKFGFPLIFLQQLGLTTSNFACRWGVPRPIIKSHPEIKVGMALG